MYNMEYTTCTIKLILNVVTHVHVYMSVYIISNSDQELIRNVFVRTRHKNLIPQHI